MFGFQNLCLNSLARKIVILSSIVVGVFFSFPVKSQIFQERGGGSFGYIILPNNEKKNGQLFNRRDDHLSFKAENGEVKEYTSSELLGYGLSSGEYFKSFSTTDDGRNSFVKVLFSGTFSLYQQESDFLLSNDEEVLMLKRSFSGNRFIKPFYLHEKAYQGTLDMLFSGYCGESLKEQIRAVKLNARDLVVLLEKYHKCENLPYELFYIKEPIARLSPVVFGGISLPHKSPASNTFTRDDFFKEGAMPYIQAGLRIYSIRKLPDFSLDLGVAYSVGRGVIQTEYFNGGTTFTGTERFRSSFVAIPLFVNYTFFKRENAEAYLGVGKVFRKNDYISDFSIVDVKDMNATILYEGSFVNFKSSANSPAFKFGLLIPRGSTFIITTEVQVDYVKNNYTVEIGGDASIYNQILSTFLVGLRFK